MEINVFMSPKSNPPFNITSREWDCVGWSAHLNSYIYTYKNIFGLFPFCSNIKWFRGNNWYKFYYISKHFFWIRFAQKIKLFLDWTFVVGNLSSNKFTVFSLCFCPRFHHELQWRSVDCLWSKWDGVNFCHVSFRVHVAGQKFPGPGRPHNHNALFLKKNQTKQHRCHRCICVSSRWWALACWCCASWVWTSGETLRRLRSLSLLWWLPSSWASPCQCLGTAAVQSIRLVTWDRASLRWLQAGARRSSRE